MPFRLKRILKRGAIQLGASVGLAGLMYEVDRFRQRRKMSDQHHEWPKLPPASIRYRSTHDVDSEGFHRGGLRGAGIVREWLPKGGGQLRVLDFGCGAGRIARHLAADPQIHLFGCDIDEEAVA